MDDATYSELAAVRDRRLEIVELIKRQQAVVELLNPSQLTEKWRGPLVRLAERVQSDSFKVLVLGQFNRGKSTFINALLAEKVLPTYATPTTAVINEVKYGEQPYVILHPRQVDGEAAIPPERVPIAELEQYVVVDAENENKPNRYERAEVYWPLELCRSGVELIDSPGLNEDPARELVTLSYLDQADALVFVLDANQPLTRNEENYLELFIRPLGHEDAFFIFNKINQVEIEERPKVEAWARKRLAPFVKFDQRIFFIDAKGALRAREEGDVQRLYETNLMAVERSLEHFLTTQRGRLKVLVPARELQVAIREGRQHVREHNELLSKDLDELLDGYRRNQPPLERLKIRVDRIVESSRRQVDGITGQVEFAARTFIADVATRLPELAASTDTNAKITINPFRIKSKTGELVNEVTEELAGVLHTEFVKWRATTYKDLVTSSLESLERDLEKDLKDFAQELDSVRLDLDLVVDDPSSDGLDVFGDVLKGRTASSVGVELGAHRGVLGIVRVAVPRAAAVAVGGVMVGLAPIVLIPVGVAVLAGWAAEGFGEQGSRLSSGVKRKIGVRASQGLREHADEYVASVTLSTKDQLDKVSAGLLNELHGKVDSLRQQVEVALEEKRVGEEKVAETKARLLELDLEMESIDAILDRLVDQILTIAEPAHAKEAKEAT